MSEVDYFSLPLGADPENDRIVGYDELGRAVRVASIGGAKYILEEQPRGPGGSRVKAAARKFVDDPLGMAGGVAKGVAQSILNGISTPGRAARGETVTYGDVADTLGLAAVGPVAGSAPKGALRSGPMRSAAQEIAEKLKLGRASDVTDSLMAQADPQEMWRLYESGATGIDMPMDAASRAARAQGMGFDTGKPLYHGTYANEDFQTMRPSQKGRIGPGVYMSPDVGKASSFSGSGDDYIAATQSPRIMPLVATNNPADETARAAARSQRNLYLDNQAQAFSDEISRRGFDGVAVADERTILNPANIRSRFARFDPRLKHLSNLSAGIAGLGIFGLMGEEYPQANAWMETKR